MENDSKPFRSASKNSSSLKTDYLENLVEQQVGLSLLFS